MTFWGNLAAYAVMLGVIIRLTRIIHADERLIQAYKKQIMAQEERHAAMVKLASALERKNALLEQEKALSAYAYQAKRIEAQTSPRRVISSIAHSSGKHKEEITPC